MTEHFFSLIPFPTPNLPDITIAGKISRQNNLLALYYSLSGDMKEISLPASAAHPSRKAELWKNTCFELFLARKDQPQYWEFNLSPSGDWNVYYMDAYRRIGFKEETSVHQLQFETQKTADTFTLNAEVELSRIFQQDDILEVGITAIIQTQDRNETYWALTHAASQADFHLRESFILELAGQTQLLGQSAQGG